MRPDAIRDNSKLHRCHDNDDDDDDDDDDVDDDEDDDDFFTVNALWPICTKQVVRKHS